MKEVLLHPIDQQNRKVDIEIMEEDSIRKTDEKCQNKKNEKTFAKRDGYCMWTSLI